MIGEPIFDIISILTSDFDFKYLFFSKVFDYEGFPVVYGRKPMWRVGYNSTGSKLSVKDLATNRKYEMLLLQQPGRKLIENRPSVQSAVDIKDWLSKVMMYKTSGTIKILEIQPYPDPSITTYD